ncbi:ATP-binding protein [Rubrivirga marina]|uniref:site-specific DNA-methyltransferase (adenine-specific) n=1 Tax=Rubrivirga marina TaxID=1196024 RepID=A0A271J089_9BACT|nr:ATP-binding protein [Rubrivirga marina]PAP76375.1 hypothetical protein BSZ37_07925 [Rubrivirga marina]
MTLDPRRVRRLLDAHDFEELFREELAWSRPELRGANEVEAAGRTYTWRQVATAGGVHAFVVESEDGGVPDAQARRAVVAEMEQLFGEPVLIFVDAARTRSLWTYVRREGGKLVVRSHLYARDQPVDLFLSKLAGLLFEVADFDEEGRLPLLKATERVRRALDVEGVTKKFYRAFQREHDALIAAIEGIPDEGDKRWYASVLLTRLMFVYFLQKKGFLDGGNRYYLEDKLRESKARLGEDSFYQGYFQELVQALFFQGLATREDQRDPEVVARIGRVPYLNGGLFLKHEVEQRYDGALDVPDEAFESLLDVFGQYDWYLDPEERPDGSRSRDFLNPDVLGYIFEKYINQKAFGAYYTRPEITEYLCDRTIDGLLLDAVNGRPAADAAPSSSATSPHRFESVNDLLVGLDDRLCARLLFDVLPGLRLLDPACGSGAFLVAALKKLLQVYQAVVGRAKLSSDGDLRDWIRDAEAGHPSLAYFLKRKVITENLFGVDLMEEATEIAKLRLFLALVASAQTVDELEPLPNVDYNVMAGNSLVGLLQVSGEDVKRYAQNDLFGRPYPELVHDKNAKTERYRRATGLDPTVDLQRTRDEIQALRAEAQPRLDHVLAAEMVGLGVRYERATLAGGKVRYEREDLRVDHVAALEPFHWGFEFAEVLAGGGFHGILANPPWDKLKPEDKEFFMAYADVVTKNNMAIEDFRKEKRALMKRDDVRAAYLDYLSTFPYQKSYFRSSADFSHQRSTANGRKVSSDLNLYQLFVERSWRLLRPGGRCGIIVPSGIYSDLSSKGLRTMLFEQSRVDSLFGLSNERYLFDDVHHSFKFTVLTFQRDGQTEAFNAAFRLNPREAVGKDRIETFLTSPSEHVHMTVDLVRRLSPQSHAVLEFRNETDRQIADTLALHARLGDVVPEAWSVSFHRELHKTGDSDLFHSTPAPGRLPLVEGKTIHQYDPSYSSPQYWVEEAEGRERLTKRGTVDKKQAYDYQTFRLTFRDVARSTDERTTIATLLPPGRFCDHTASLIWTRDVDGKPLVSDAEQLYLLAVFNSVVFDWLIRLKVGMHLSLFLVESQPVPRLTEADPAFRPIVEAAARLTCVDAAFDPLAAEVGVEGETDPSARAALRAELDARVAHVYGVTREELGHVLGTFPLVEDEYKAAVMEAYGVLADAAQAPPDDADTARVAAAGESDRVEFKSTLRRALNPQVPDRVIEHEVLKTVAAFLNTDGGTLLIGVDDGGQPLGLDHDGFDSDDRMLLHLKNIVERSLGVAAFSSLSFRVVDLGGQRVLRVDARPAPEPTYLTDKVESDAFYVRTGPSSTSLSLRHAVGYIARTFPRD